MEFIVFCLCLTALVALILFFNYMRGLRTEYNIRTAYDRATEFQQSALHESSLRSEAANQHVEQTLAQVTQLSTDIAKVSRLNVYEIQRDFQEFKLECVNEIGHATAEACGHVKSQELRTRTIDGPTLPDKPQERGPDEVDDAAETHVTSGGGRKG